MSNEECPIDPVTNAHIDSMGEFVKELRGKLAVIEGLLELSKNAGVPSPKAIEDCIVDDVIRINSMIVDVRKHLSAILDGLLNDAIKEAMELMPPKEALAFMRE